MSIAPRWAGVALGLGRWGGFLCPIARTDARSEGEAGDEQEQGQKVHSRLMIAGQRSEGGSGEDAVESVDYRPSLLPDQGRLLQVNEATDRLRGRLTADI